MGLLTEIRAFVVRLVSKRCSDRARFDLNKYNNR